MLTISYSYISFEFLVQARHWMPNYKLELGKYESYYIYFFKVKRSGINVEIRFNNNDHLEVLSIVNISFKVWYYAWFVLFTYILVFWFYRNKLRLFSRLALLLSFLVPYLELFPRPYFLFPRPYWLHFAQLVRCILLYKRIENIRRDFNNELQSV